MLGTGFCGLKHGHIFALYELVKNSTEAFVTGAFEDETSYAQAAEKVIKEPFYGSYDEMLADPRVQIVAVGDAYGARGAEIIKALRAGKHVLSDKPLCTRKNELDEIRRLSLENGLCVGCMLDLRYDPALRKTAEIVRSGELGEIHAVNFSGQHPLNYGVRPEWYFTPERHGGTFNDLIIHGIDAVSWITGLTQLEVVSARGYNAFAKEQPSFRDCAQMMGRYENGAGLVADISYSAPNGCAFSLPSYWRFSFWGDKGMAECTFGSGLVMYAKAGGSAETIHADSVNDNCLTDLIKRINGEETRYCDELLFGSAETALRIQEAADRQ